MTEPLVFRPAKAKFLLMALPCLAIAGLFAMLAAAGMGVVGWIVVAVFGIVAIVLLLNLLPNASYLRLTEEGLEIRSLFCTDELNWKDIEHFGVVGKEGAQIVGIQFSDSVHHSVGRSMARHLSGFDGGLSAIYGQSAEELARILNECKDAVIQ